MSKGSQKYGFMSYKLENMRPDSSYISGKKFNTLKIDYGKLSKILFSRELSKGTRINTIENELWVRWGVEVY